MQAPAFLVEYDDTQDDANHIHSVWRDFDDDFGVDLLNEHYKQAANDPRPRALARRLERWRYGSARKR